MADVKWIKISTDIFDNRKIRQILKMPNGDKLTNIWFRLLCMTGISNNHGLITLTDDIPYTVEMLAAEFCEDEEIVQTAVDVFQRFGMIGQEDGVFYVNNWEEYQNIDGMEKIKEQNRDRKRKERENKKNNTSRDSHVTVTNDVTSTSRDSHAHVTQQDIDIDNRYRDIEKDSEEKTEGRNRNREETVSTPSPHRLQTVSNYDTIVEMFNNTCLSFPRVKTKPISRMNTVNDRLAQYSLADFQRAFEKVEASDFLKGDNPRGWKANFDWIIKDENMAKILDGNYDRAAPAKEARKKNKAEQEFDDMQDMLVEWVNERTAEQEATGT